MSQVSSLIVERFKRLPRLSDDRWQGGLARLPSWIERGPEGKPYRPWAGIWVSLKTGLINLKLEPEPGAHDWTLALDALLEFGLKRNLAGCRPGSLEVADEELGSRLLDALGDRDLTLAVSPGLPAVTRVLAEMSKQMAGAPLPPDALNASGVTVDRMRTFAEAAKRFYEAAPWRYLSDEDLIHVEAPAAQRGLTHVTVLGAARQTFGLGFFESVDDHNEVQERLEPEALVERPRWSLFFGPISEMPFGDADLWGESGLPVAGDDAYPVAIRFSPDGKLRRPDAAILSYLEGLLRTLAQTTEGEIDQGRWTCEVETFDGPVAYQLAIPSLLEPLDAPQAIRRAGLPDRRAMERVMLETERFMARSEFKNLEQVNEALRRRFSGPMDAIPSTASTPLEKAQELAYQAFEARGRRRVQLARKALDLSADCADAYVILAEQTGDLNQACDLYAQGVAAGGRALGPRIFAEEAGHFWGLITTRPYMRARFGLAQCLEALGQPDEAIGHYRELLRLNPNDILGVRYTLLPALLAGARDDEAGALLGQFEDDGMALWQYGRAFRREGDSGAARESLRQALRANRRVPKYLTGEEELPDADPFSYAPGSEEEAVICARALADAWRAMPGAADWLRAHTPVKKSRKRRRR
ncbi:MAG: tetratricopeptide repeat protein [Candidatus Rokubacteria bacterium]|nr:tetratricopeptide repeat protein [Candidatus Rokubacteria bacterium]